MSVNLWRAILAVSVTAEAAAFGIYLHVAGGYNGHLWLEITSTIAFVVAVLALRAAGLTARRAAVGVLFVGAVLQIIALTKPPQTSDDDFRYIWDAKVQLSGTDPYRYTPASPALAHLRSAPVFGADGPCTYGIPDGCTAINRPTVHTIYPPVAEAAFSAIRIVSFGDHGIHLPLQIAAALGCCLISLLLVRRAMRRGDPVWLSAIWAWCPIIVSEFGNNAHIDWLAVLLSVLGFNAYAAGRLGRAGVLIGAAIATKLYPGVLLASLLRTRPWLVLGSALGFVALSYVPHVAAVGTSVIGYLPGYLHEEGYSTGNHLLLLGAIFPHPVDTLVGVLIVGGAGLWAWRRTDALAPENTAVVVLGVALLVATPRYGWYAALLVALIVMSRRIEWLPVAFTSSFSYLIHGGQADPQIFAVGGGLTAVGLIVRRVIESKANGRITSKRRSRATVSVGQ